MLACHEEPLDVRSARGGKEVGERRQIRSAKALGVDPDHVVGPRQRHRQVLTTDEPRRHRAIEDELHRCAHSRGKRQIGYPPVIDGVEVHDRRGAERAQAGVRPGERPPGKKRRGTIVRDGDDDCIGRKSAVGSRHLEVSLR